MVSELGSTLDLMATFAHLADTDIPHDRTLDSLNLTPAMLGEGPSPRGEFFYWTRAQLHAARLGPWKLHLKMRESVQYGKLASSSSPVLYHVEHDISEKYDVADRHPEIVALIQDSIARHRHTIEEVPDNLAK